MQILKCLLTSIIFVPLTFASASTTPKAFISSLPGCNEAAWDQVPKGTLGAPDLFVGRQFRDGGCNQTHPWVLTVAKMDWNTHNLTVVNSNLFKTPQTIYGGFKINSAYDATLLWAYNELWIAFECSDASMLTPSSCMGPINTHNDPTGTSWTVDPLRTTVVSTGNCTDNLCHSSSVPKVFFWRGLPYMYYSAVHMLSSNRQWLNVSMRGIALRNTNRAGGGIFWEKNSSAPIGAVDWHSAEVMKIDPNDPLSNQVVDGFGVYTDGPAGNETHIYMTGGLGGSSNTSCITSPAGVNPWTSVGCYRQFIARSTAPLGNAIFNTYRVSEHESYMPANGSQYVRRFYDNNGNSMLWGMYIQAPTGTPLHVLSPSIAHRMYAYPLDFSDLNYQTTYTYFKAGQLNSAPGFVDSFANGSLEYQTDGNLVLYNAYHQALWSTTTASLNYCAKHTCSARFQKDGNLILYRDNTPYWASRTAGSGAYALFSIRPSYDHAQIEDSSKQIVWKEGFGGVWSYDDVLPIDIPLGTQLYAGESIDVIPGYGSTGGYSTLRMQADGNLVLYAGNTALWATSMMPAYDAGGFSGPTQQLSCADCFAAFQSDGNIVLYNPNFLNLPNHAYWASQTNGLSDVSFRASITTLLQVVNSTGKVIWSAAN